MKKAKKRLPSGLRPSSSVTARKIANGPPDSFLSEMVARFHAGRYELFGQMALEAVHRWPGHPAGWKGLGTLGLMQGRMAEALEPLSRAAKLDPDDAQVQHNLGSVLLQLRRLEEAEACYRQALALAPEYVQAHSNLGITLFELGRYEEAAASYRQALALEPDFAEAHNNLGNALKELKRYEDAEACFRQALAVKPDFAEAHSNLGLVLLRLRRPEEAEKSYRQALAFKPDYARAHKGLGDTLLMLKQAGAIASYRQGLAIEPMNVEAQDRLNEALRQLIPPWHVPMMNDQPRNDAYYAALQAAISPEAHVLEIGTGSGLLAMMAAKLGARQVTTCEAVPEIAETARAIVADNGFSRTVEVVAKISTKMEIGADMDGRADLLVSEILSSEFLGEGVLPSIEDAKRRLLKPGARIIPARGSIQFALFGGADIEKNLRVDTVCGFDLRRFNSIVARKQFLSRNDLGIELLSDDATAFFFDFAGTERFASEERKTLEVPVRDAGRCCGIIQWIRLEMDDTGVFENHPLDKNPASGWQHCIYAFPEPVEVHPGQVAVIVAAHNRSAPWFFFEGLK